MEGIIYTITEEVGRFKISFAKESSVLPDVSIFIQKYEMPYVEKRVMYVLSRANEKIQRDRMLNGVYEEFDYSELDRRKVELCAEIVDELTKLSKEST